MSYLLIKNPGGGKPQRPPPSFRNTKRNPQISVRSTGAGGGTSFRPSSSHGPSNGNSNYPRPSTANAVVGGNNGVGMARNPFVERGGPGANGGNGHNGVMVSDGGGQVQLQRVAPMVQRAAPQQQHQQPPQSQQTQEEKQTEQNMQGVVSMDEVMNDIRILEQQQRDSQRMLESIKLTKQHKLEQKSGLETKLSKLKFKNGEMRTELQRANKELSMRHRELLEARTRCENSRKATNRFDSKLKRAVGVARILGVYANKIESSMIALNESETRLNFLKGQTIGKLNAAVVRRDDAKHRHELLLKAIYSNQQRERALTEDISKIRAEIAGNEHDLSSAQQMESQTKLRVETIEHEVQMERNRHVEAMSDLETKAKDIDESKSKTQESIEEKKAMIEAKKEELLKIWKKCTDLRQSEGHDVLPEPKWGIDQVPSLDVARIRVRVNAEEVELRGQKTEREKLQNDIVQLESKCGSNEAEISETCEKAEALKKSSEQGYAEESLRKEKVEAAVKEADLECKEVEKLQESVKDLTATQEKNSEDMKLKNDKHDKEIASAELEIEGVISELSSTEKHIESVKASEETKKEQALKELADAKGRSDIIKGAFERAQKSANDFASVPDDDLIAQMKLLDEAEQGINSDANREREEIIESEPILEQLKIEYYVDAPDDGISVLKSHCLGYIVAARNERQIRVEQARDAHFERIEAEEEARRQEEEMRRVEELKRKEEEKIAAEKRRLELELLERKREEARRRVAEEAAAEKRRLELEAEEKRRKEEELERIREEEEAKRLEEERERQIALEEERRKAEAKRKEEEAAAAAAAAEKKRKEEEKRLRDEKRRKDREAREAAKAAAEKKRKEEREAREAERAAAAKRRREEREAREAEKKAAAEKKRKEEREAREAELAADAKRRKEEREAREAEEAAAAEKSRREELEARELEKAAAKRREEERKARKAEEAAAEKRREEKRRAREAEKAAAEKRREEERQALEVEKAEKAAAEKRRKEEREAKKRKEKDLEEMRARTEEVQRKLRLEEEHQQEEEDRKNEERRRKMTEKMEEREERKMKEEKRQKEADRVERKQLEDEARRSSKEDGAKKQRRLYQSVSTRVDEEFDLPSDGEPGSKGFDFGLQSEDDIDQRRSKKRDLAHRIKSGHVHRETKAAESSNSASNTESYRQSGGDKGESSLPRKKQRPSKSYGKAEPSKDLGKSSHIDKTKHKMAGDERPRDGSGTIEHRSKHKRTMSSRDEKMHTSSKSDRANIVLSLPSQSAIKQKDSKRPKLSSSVRFDQSATRPKLDIFSSGVPKREEKKSKSSKSSKPSSKPSTQSSGISSCEGVGRRRKKVQVKSKSKSAALGGFEDDGGFLNF